MVGVAQSVRVDARPQAEPLPGYPRVADDDVGRPCPRPTSRSGGSTGLANEHRAARATGRKRSLAATSRSQTCGRRRLPSAGQCRTARPLGLSPAVRIRGNPHGAALGTRRRPVCRFSSRSTFERPWPTRSRTTRGWRSVPSPRTAPAPPSWLQSPPSLWRSTPASRRGPMPPATPGRPSLPAGRKWRRVARRGRGRPPRRGSRLGDAPTATCAKPFTPAARALTQTGS